MKKLLSLILAFAMVFSLSSVAFADDEDELKEYLGGKYLARIAEIPYGIDDYLGEGRDFAIPLAYLEYIRQDEEDRDLLAKSCPYLGDSIYYPVEAIRFADDIKGGIEMNVRTGIRDILTLLNASAIAKNYTLTPTWEIGGEYVKDVKFSAKMSDVSVIMSTFAPAIRRKAQTLIEIETNPLPISEPVDIVGTIKVKSKKPVGINLIDPFKSAITAAESEIDRLLQKFEKEVTINVAFTLYPGESKNAEDEKSITDTNTLFSFGEGSEEESLSLYGNMGRFDVNTIGQGDLVLSSNVEFNEGIENISKDAAYSYFNGNGATFNKIGTLYLSASYGDRLYKVESDGTLKEIDGNYDPDEEAFKIRTRTLGSYVIAEKELDLEKINSSVLGK